MSDTTAGAVAMVTRHIRVSLYAAFYRRAEAGIIAVLSGLMSVVVMELVCFCLSLWCQHRV